MFSRAKCLQQQPAVAKVGEEMEVITIDHDESHCELDSEVEYAFEDSSV